MGKGGSAGLPGPWKEARRGAGGWGGGGAGASRSGLLGAGRQVRPRRPGACAPPAARRLTRLRLQPERIDSDTWLTGRMNVLHSRRAAGFYWRPKGKLEQTTKGSPRCWQLGLRLATGEHTAFAPRRAKAAQQRGGAGGISRRPQPSKSHGGGGAEEVQEGAALAFLLGKKQGNGNEVYCPFPSSIVGKRVLRPLLSSRLPLFRAARRAPRSELLYKGGRGAAMPKGVPSLSQCGLGEH